MKKISPQYLAGVADSDGSFSIHKGHKTRKKCYYTTHFQLTWVANKDSLRTLRLIQSKYGGSITSVAPRAKWSSYKNTKPYYKYCLSAKAIEQFLIDIIPYLNLKKKQAIALM